MLTTFKWLTAKFGCAHKFAGQVSVVLNRFKKSALHHECIADRANLLRVSTLCQRRSYLAHFDLAINLAGEYQTICKLPCPKQTYDLCVSPFFTAQYKNLFKEEV